MHVAIIMNGNGRWATQRALPPSVGRVAGVAALRGTVESAAESGVRTLTLEPDDSQMRMHLRIVVDYSALSD